MMKGYRNRTTKFQPSGKGRERKRKRKNTTSFAAKIKRKSMSLKQNFGKIK